MYKSIVLPLALFANIAFAGQGHEFCTYEKSELDVAEVLKERCDMGTISDWDLAEMITIEDDADGPGYKDLDYYYKGESVAHQLLFEAAAGCMIEDNFEVYCPNKP